MPASIVDSFLFYSSSSRSSTAGALSAVVRRGMFSTSERRIAECVDPAGVGEEDRGRLEGVGSDRHHRGAAVLDVREDEGPLGRPSVDLHEMGRVDRKNSARRVEDGEAMDVSMQVDAAHGPRLEAVAERLQGDGDRELPHPEDSFGVGPDSHPFADLSPVRGVEGEQGFHVPTDEPRTGAHPSLGLVVADDRGNGRETTREVPLGDAEILPPLAQRAAGMR